MIIGVMYAYILIFKVCSYTVKFQFPVDYKQMMMLPLMLLANIVGVKVLSR